MMKKFLFVAVIALALFSCETEVDLNAPYESKTVVFGLLDPVQDTQWIKINRTFLGDGNNLDYAAIRDSNEYKLDEFNSLVVEELLDGEVVNTFNLVPKELNNKSINGIFYGPNQTAYYFVKNGGLNEDAVYRLKLDFKDKEDVTAQTEIVKATEVAFFNEALILSSGQELKLASSDLTEVFRFLDYTGGILGDESAPFYEVAVRMNLTERVYTDATHSVLVSERPVVIEYSAGQFTEENFSGANNRINYTVSGSAFFTVLGSSLKKDDNVVYQIGQVASTPHPGTDAFDLVIYYGGRELYTYFQVNSPTTGIVQERPTYSNINNGLGLFSSRSTRVMAGIPIAGTNPSSVPNIGNILALRFSEQTSQITFCDPGAEAVEYIPTCQ